MMKNQLITTHKLDFEMCNWGVGGINLFRVGTVNGQWLVQDKSYCILSVINDKPHNGHFEDLLQWFEHSCKCEGYTLKILHVMNERFKKHLIEKRGFTAYGDDHVEKHFQ